MIKVKEIVKTCDSCPSQWDGFTDDNRQLSIRVGKVGDMSEFGGVGGDSVLEIDKNDQYHGVMEYAELRELARDVVSLPDFESEDLLGKKVHWKE